MKNKSEDTYNIIRFNIETDWLLKIRTDLAAPYMPARVHGNIIQPRCHSYVWILLRLATILATLVGTPESMADQKYFSPMTNSCSRLTQDCLWSSMKINRDSRVSHSVWTAWVDYKHTINICRILCYLLLTDIFSVDNRKNAHCE